MATPTIPEYPFTPRGLPAPKRARILRCLVLGWRPDAIAEECNVGLRTVYRIEENLFRYGSIVKPRYRMLGLPSKCTEADKNALFEWLLREGWRHQDEMVYWLWHERGVYVSQSTISRLLKKKKWTRKELRRISLGRSEELREAYRNDMRRFVADDLVFLDESIFNEKTGWRH